jgi:ribulose-5-phosphate 4-epimerase/fuculose-1-phosphate aldolase
MAGSTSAPTDVATLTDDVATVLRAAVELQLVDHAGFVACRMPDGSILTTPGPAVAGRFRHLRVDDLVRAGATDVDAHADPGRRLPRELALAAELLGDAPGSTLIAGCGAATLRLAAVGRHALPLAHTNAELVHAGIAIVRPTRVALDPAAARTVLAPVLADAPPTIVLAGSAVLVRAPSPFEALRRLDALELLAQLTVALGQDDATRALTPDEAAAIARSRPVEVVPSRDPVRYFRTIDPGVGLRTLADDLPATPAPVDLDEARTLLAVASRVLAVDGLVTYYEHLASRVPGAEDRFLMTPAHDYARMLPSDIGVLATDEDCTPIECRFPPAPFRWFHRDLLAARSDVDAIVHVHPLHARVRYLRPTPRRTTAWHRASVRAPEHVVVFPRPSLLFDPADRAELLAMLGDAPAAHGLHHGTDHLARTVAEASIAAIHDERLDRLHAEVATLGTPSPLAATYVDELRAHGPTADDEMAFRASFLTPLRG